MQLPFTVEFDITRNTLTSANVCQIRIYNLSPKNRNLIRKNVNDYNIFRLITLKAGYGSNMPVIFTGNITQAWSVREGVNFITQIECFDGGFAFANSLSNVVFPANTAQNTVIKTLTEDLDHVSVGAIGSYPGQLSRGNSYSGSTTGLLAQITGGGFFIDNGRANVLGTNECLLDIGGTKVINAKLGLLGTPVLERTIVHFDMIFEPSLFPAQRIFLESATDVNFNGDYKVTAVKHRGMISAAVCGEAITTGEFFYSKILTEVAQSG